MALIQHNGVIKFVQHLKEKTYKFGQHNQAENDYSMYTSLLKLEQNDQIEPTIDEVIKRVFVYDGRCPNPDDFELKFDSECEISSFGDDDGCVDTNQQCANCWTRFLTKISKLE